MINRSICFGLVTAGLVVLQSGCGRERDRLEETAEKQTAAETAPGVVELRAVGKTFEGPPNIPSGWTTFRFVNASNMIHFAIIDVPPEGITIGMVDEVMTYFQEAMNAMNAGDDEAAGAAFGKFPAWIGELGRNGGPGLLSPGRIGQTTVYLEPGYTIVECYVKSDGIFHTTSPGEGQLGMMMELTVTEEVSGRPEPESNVRVAVRNSGFEITEGAFHPGTNTVRVDFLEQQAFPSFVGNDIHLMRVDSKESIELASAWLDWRLPKGLEDPAPVTFLGGINDLPAGQHGYFTVVLEAGDYALISEVPDPPATGLVLTFTVTGAD